MAEKFALISLFAGLISCSFVNVAATYGGGYNVEVPRSVRSLSRFALTASVIAGALVLFF